MKCKFLFILIGREENDKLEHHTKQITYQPPISTSIYLDHTVFKHVLNCLSCDVATTVKIIYFKTN